jgi:hypothetical protein
VADGCAFSCVASDLKHIHSTWRARLDVSRSGPNRTVVDVDTTVARRLAEKVRLDGIDC